jgi:hypothetical protein
VGAANNHLQYDRLIANVPLRHVDVEVGKSPEYVGSKRTDTV